MRGVRLDDLVKQLRAEVGHSTNPGVGLNAEDYLKQVLRRTQDRLWEEHDWAHLKVSRDISTQAGLRYYSVPVDLAYERINEVSFKYGSDWHILCHGIDERDYSVYDSDRDERNWPVMKWDVAEDTGVVDDIGVVEIWPVPSRSANTTDGQIRFTGIRKIASMVSGEDKCELDGTLIVLMAAAEIQARQNQSDAQVKMEQARQLLTRLMNQGQNKKKKTHSFSNMDDDCCDGFRPRIVGSVTSIGGGSPGDGECCVPCDPILGDTLVGLSSGEWAKSQYFRVDEETAPGEALVSIDGLASMTGTPVQPNDLVPLWYLDDLEIGGLRVFDTVADMVAAEGLAVGQNAITLGYHNVGDGGGNSYLMIASGSIPEDGGRFINLTGSPAAQAQGTFPGLEVNVKQWGAVGDGVTDDSAAFQAALTGATFLTIGGTIKVPAFGRWFIGSTITIPGNTSLIRDGMPPLTREMGAGVKPGFDGMVYMGAGAGIEMEENSALKGLTLLNNALTFPVADISGFAGTAVLIKGFDGGPIAAHDVRIENMNILGFEYAILSSSDNTERTYIDKVKMDCLTGVQLVVSRDTCIVQDCHAWPFLTAHSATEGAKYRPGTGFVMYGGIDWAVVENCFAYHYQVGFLIFDGATTTLQNCQSDADSTDTINTTGAGFVVGGDSLRPRLLGCTAYAKKNPFLVATTASDIRNPVVIEGCSTWGNEPGNAVVTVSDGNLNLIGCSFSGWDYGVRREAGAGVVMVSGCSFSDFKGSVFIDDPAVTLKRRWVIGDNQYVGVWSIDDASSLFPTADAAATLTIRDFARTIRVLGNTQIDFIDGKDAPAGVPFVLYFDEITTVTSDGNIILIGGTREIRAGGTLHLMMAEGNYMEINSGGPAASGDFVPLAGTAPGAPITGPLEFNESADDEIWHVGINTDDSFGVKGFYIAADNTIFDGDFQVITNSNVLKYTSAGYLGIGTALPEHRLHVVGGGALIEDYLAVATLGAAINDDELIAHGEFGVLSNTGIRNDEVVLTRDAQTVGGQKTFTATPIFNTNCAIIGAPQDTTSENELIGIQAQPFSLVARSGIKANEIVKTSRSITAGDGLSGGGSLASNVHIQVDASVVRTSGDQTIGGVKTFSANPICNTIAITAPGVDPTAEVIGLTTAFSTITKTGTLLSDLVTQTQLQALRDELVTAGVLT